jgi:hypothetical protein
MENSAQRFALPQLGYLMLPGAEAKLKNKITN